MIRDLFLRFAIHGLVPARLFAPPPPSPSELTPRTGRLTLEIVSHCWNYHHLHAYQLSSLVLFPPRDIDITMTVFHSDADRGTTDLLGFFGGMDVRGVTWNWRPLPEAELMRRAIGRNRAALATRADWIWFADCDLMFRDDCLDALGSRLQGKRDALCFPRQESVTPLLTAGHPLLTAAMVEPRVVDVETSLFSPRPITRAVGAYQIVHGDVARAMGYCATLPFFQSPADRWRKTYEDRAYRWLLRSEGVPMDIPGIHRIRHAAKGRYTGGRAMNWARRSVRRLKVALTE